MMIPPVRLLACAAAALVLPLPVAAAPPDGYTLPEPTPTPAPAPAGPADERAGVAIPPRAIPAPQITPAPMLAPEPTRAPASAPARAPSPQALPPVPAAPRSDAATVPVPPLDAAPDDTLEGAVPNAPPPAPPPLPVPVPVPVPDAPAPAQTAATLPAWWPWAAGALGGLALLGGGLLLWRRRPPKVLRLAALPPGIAAAAPVPALPQPDTTLDITLDITGATRSVMMVSLHYRLTLANRTPGAVSKLSAAVQIVSARRRDRNAASPGAAQQLQTIDRIGPHQSRSITGTVQLPVAGLAILRQGSAAMFIPLAHVTVEGDRQSALTRSFVIGTPSTSGTGKLHPIRLDTPPGSIPGLRAQAVAIPAVCAAE